MSEAAQRQTAAQTLKAFRLTDEQLAEIRAGQLRAFQAEMAKAAVGMQTSMQGWGQRFRAAMTPRPPGGGS